MFQYEHQAVDLETYARTGGNQPVSREKLVKDLEATDTGMEKVRCIQGMDISQ